VVERAGAVTADSEPSESCTAVELKLSSPASPTTVPATTICARFMWASWSCRHVHFSNHLKGERLLMDSVVSNTQS